MSRKEGQGSDRTDLLRDLRDLQDRISRDPYDVELRRDLRDLQDRIAWAPLEIPTREFRYKRESIEVILVERNAAPPPAHQTDWLSRWKYKLVAAAVFLLSAGSLLELVSDALQSKFDMLRDHPNATTIGVGMLLVALTVAGLARFRPKR
jgi:hypothetical protein